MFNQETRPIVLDYDLHERLRRFWKEKQEDPELKIEKDVKDYWHSLIPEMNERLIKNWNSQVSDEDNVYHLGDFSFMNPHETKKILARLNGKIHLVTGNHENMLKDRSVHQYFESIKDQRFVTIDGIFVHMLHYPILEWNKMHHGSFHLFGHVHGKDMGIPGKAMDVGIDARPNGDMMLWTWEEIVKYMEHRPVMGHH